MWLINDISLSLETVHCRCSSGTIIYTTGIIFLVMTSDNLFSDVIYNRADREQFPSTCE